MAQRNNKGGIGPWRGKQRQPFSEEWKRNLSLARQRKKERDGFLNSEITRHRLSVALKGKPKPLYVRERMRGKNSMFWKGGVSSIIRVLRERTEYKEWRKAVYERDNYTCQLCGKVGGRLNVDHILPLSIIIKVSDWKHMIYDTDNGRVVCVPCHKKTWSYGKGTSELQRRIELLYPAS